MIELTVICDQCRAARVHSTSNASRVDDATREANKSMRGWQWRGAVLVCPSCAPAEVKP